MIPVIAETVSAQDNKIQAPRLQLTKRSTSGELIGVPSGLAAVMGRWFVRTELNS